MAEKERSKKKGPGKGATLLMVLLAILAALAATYGIVCAYNAKAAENAGGTGELTEMLSFTNENIKSFSYLYGNDIVTLERDGDQWIYTDEPDWDLDEDAVEDMLSSISSVTTEQVVADPADSDTLGEYGLDDPTFLVSLNFSDGSANTLYLGIENPMTGMTYATVNKESVFTVNSSLSGSFSAPEDLAAQDGSTDDSSSETAEDGNDTADDSIN